SCGRGTIAGVGAAQGAGLAAEGKAYRDNMYIMRSGGFQSRSASKSSMSRGAIRARMFNKSWKCASLKKVIDKFAPGSKAKLSENGKKIIYENGVSSKRVVYDKDGNYFRIEDTSAQGKRVYVDMNGNIPN